MVVGKTEHRGQRPHLHNRMPLLSNGLHRHKHRELHQPPRLKTGSMGMGKVMDRVERRGNEVESESFVKLTTLSPHGINPLHEFNPRFTPGVFGRATREVSGNHSYHDIVSLR